MKKNHRLLTALLCVFVVVGITLISVGCSKDDQDATKYDAADKVDKASKTEHPAGEEHPTATDKAKTPEAPDHPEGDHPE